jgi:hypothetical protein
MVDFTTSVNLTTKRYKGRLGGKTDIIVIHTMEAPEGPQTAENIANYFQRVDASSHWCIDNNSRVRVVLDGDTAWTTPGVNARSLNIELAGYARQTAAEWADQYSIDELEIAAISAAEWVNKYGIPIRKLTDAQLSGGEKGFIGHVDASRVYKKSSHWDPGPAFPWDYFLSRVAAHAGGNVTPPPAGNGQPPVDQRPRNVDGSLTIAVDGIRGPATIGRWQEVLGTPIDFNISKPKSTLIQADQRFLNSVVSPEHIKNLTGKSKLDEDGIEGAKTVKVRQFWLRNAMNPQHQKNLIGKLLDVDGILGPDTNRVHQFALNNATSHSGRYGQV